MNGGNLNEFISKPPAVSRCMHAFVPFVGEAPEQRVDDLLAALRCDAFPWHGGSGRDIKLVD